MTAIMQNLRPGKPSMKSVGGFKKKLLRMEKKDQEISDLTFQLNMLVGMVLKLDEEYKGLKEKRKSLSHHIYRLAAKARSIDLRAKSQR